MKLYTKIRLWWNKFFIRKDEFHKSLNMDINAMLEMSKAEQESYIQDLVRRRNIAHERDINKIND